MKRNELKHSRQTGGEQDAFVSAGKIELQQKSVDDSSRLAVKTNDDMQQKQTDEDKLALFMKSCVIPQDILLKQNEVEKQVLIKKQKEAKEIDLINYEFETAKKLNQQNEAKKLLSMKSYENKLAKKRSSVFNRKTIIAGVRARTSKRIADETREPEEVRIADDKFTTARV